MADRNINYKINVSQGRRDGVDSIRQTQREVDALESEVRKAARAADNLDDSLDKVGRGSVNIGRASGGIERLVNAIDGGLGGALLGLANDAGDVVEALSENGLRGAVSALVTPAGLAVAAAGALALGISKVTEQYEIQKKAAEDHIAALITASQKQVEFNQLLRDGGVEAVEAQQKNLEDQRAILEAGRNTAQAEVDRLRALVEEQKLSTLGSFGTSTIELEQNLIALSAAETALSDAEKKLADLSPGLSAFDRILVSLTETINTATDRAGVKAQGAFEILKIGADEFIDAAEGAGEAITAVFEKTRENLVAADNDRFTKNLASSMALQAERADSLTDSLGKMGEMLKDSREAAEEITDTFAELQKSTQDTVDKLDIDGTRLGDALRNTIADLNAELVSAQQDAANDIAEARADAAAAELEAVTTFQRDQARAQRDFEREQKRIRDDARRSELDAIEANDIQALLRNDESREAQLRDNRERFKDAQSDRQADFEARRAAEQTALAETIAGIEQQRDAEIASINARIAAERASFDAQIAEINRLKEAQIAQIDAVIAANERKHVAEIAAIDAAANRWEALVLYQNGKLYQLNPALKNSPPTLGSVLAVPPPPVDPFGIGNFFNSPPPPSTEGALSTPPPTINMPPGAVIVGDIASKTEVYDAVYNAVRAAAAALYTARTGVSA